MAFTLGELREELEALGYGALPNDFIVSSLSQLQLQIPPWWNHDTVETDRYSTRRGRTGKSSRRVHGPPVPGDREFEMSKKWSTSKGGLNSVCFTPDFATELEEMRKMLRIMQGKNDLIGSVSTQRTNSKPMGLTDEHELYVGNLLDQWRLVGKTLRGKRSKGPVAGVEASTCIIEALHSDYWRHHLEQQEIQLPPLAEPATGRDLEACDDRCDVQAGNTYPGDEGVTLPEGNSENRPVDECFVKSADCQEEELDAGGGETNLEDRELNVSNSGKAVGVEGNDTGPVFTRQESSSAISPGVSYQQGGMLYQENFIDLYKQSDLLVSEEVLPSHQDPVENPTPSPRSSAQTPKDVLDKLSALSNDQFLAAFEKSIEDLDPQDVIDQETFASVNQKITDTTSSSPVNLCCSVNLPVESENPVDFGVPVLRTPDRRGGRHQSPLNDRSNIRTLEDTGVPQDRAKAVFKITESNSAVASKRNSSVTLKRSRSSRDSRRSETEEANGAHPAEVRGDPCLAVKTTPPSSARKVGSEKVPRHPLSEKGSPRIPLRNKGASDESQLDISSLGLSPIKVKEPASPLKFSSRERPCVSNGYPEHRLGTCSVCPPPSVRKSGDSSCTGITGSKSPFGKNLENAFSGESEASPIQKPTPRKEIGASPKQKLPKRGSGPSGIYTPLVDQKKHEINSKVLLKTSRLASSMDFASESSRLADRRSPSLRSSTESSRSSGRQRGSSSSQISKSDSGSIPFAKSSSFSSFGSRSSTSKDMLTPGGPRRGGKVDRVARVLEDMRPSTEPPPFVVPTLYSTSESLCIF